MSVDICCEIPSVSVCATAREWDEYVGTATGASSYHRWVWRDVIRETYGHPSHYLAAYVGGTVRGVLPLVEINSRLFGHFLVSMPFFTYGGVVGANDIIREALLTRAAELGKELGVKHIELRQPPDLSPKLPWTLRTPKSTFHVEIPLAIDDLWKALSSDMRKKIRRSLKHELRVEWGGPEAIPTFYNIFSTNMRDLGTPVYPRAWFENICKHVPDEAHFLTIWDGKHAVASGMITTFRDTVELPWSGSLLPSRKKFSPSLMYWSVMEWAAAHGYHRVDLGRCTPGSGTYEFKSHFPSVAKPLPWHYWLAEGTKVPELRPDNPRYRLPSRIWRHLPLSIANLVGPHIVRSIP